MNNNDALIEIAYDLMKSKNKQMTNPRKKIQPSKSNHDRKEPEFRQQTLR